MGCLLVPCETALEVNFFHLCQVNLNATYILTRGLAALLFCGNELHKHMLCTHEHHTALNWRTKKLPPGYNVQPINHIGSQRRPVIS